MHSDAQEKDNKQSDAQGGDNKQSNAQDTDNKQKVSNTQVIGHTTYIHTHTHSRSPTNKIHTRPCFSARDM